MTSGGINRLGGMALGAGIAGLVGFPVGLLQTYAKSAGNTEKRLPESVEKTPSENSLHHEKNNVNLVQDLVNHLEKVTEKWADSWTVKFCKNDLLTVPGLHSCFQIVLDRSLLRPELQLEVAPCPCEVYTVAFSMAFSENCSTCFSWW